MTRKAIWIYLSCLVMLTAPLLIAGQSYFTENKGQWPSKVRYKTEYPGAIVYLESNAITFDTYHVEQFDEWAHGHTHKLENPVDFIQAHAFQLRFIDPSPGMKIIAEGKSADYENYFVGDPIHWANNAHNYKNLKYQSIYPNVDIEVKRSSKQFKYDWVVKPGGNIDDIRFNYLGAEKIRVKKGKLIIETKVKNFVEYIPLAYYKKGNDLIEIPVHYQKTGNAIGFKVLRDYPKECPLYIDPVLIFSTYSGSTANNFGYTATFDSKGFLYAGSTAFGTGYPAVLGAYNMFQGGTIDVAITKYDTTGTFRVYSTYLGGSNNEMPHSMIVNSNDELFVYGTSGSVNFPTSDNAYQSTNNLGTAVDFGNGLGFAFDQGEDIFVTRLSEDGLNLLASTFVGGSGTDGLNVSSQLVYNYADQVRGEILIDANDNIYVVSSTQSNDFPVSDDAYQTQLNGSQDGVIIKMDNNLTSLVWASYFGGSGADAFYAMDLDSDDNPIVCGGTTSDNLPVSNAAYQQSYAGNTDGFLVKFNAQGSSLESMTYLGFEEYDQIYFVEFDSGDAAFVFGQTETGNSYNANNLYSNANSGQFLGILSPDLSDYQWGMNFGNGNGNPNISPTAFLVDVCDQIYLTGWGSSIQGGNLTTSNLPVSIDAYQSSTDGNDFYIYITGTDLLEPAYASYFGGNQSTEHVDGGTSRFDKTGKIYQGVCAGCGGNNDFPFFPSDAVSNVNGNSCNLGVFKMDFEEDLVIADFAVEAVCWPDPVQFENFSFNAQSYQWFFGDTGESSLPNPSHNYSGPGLYDVSLVVSNPGTCNESDTLTKQILVLSPDGFELDDLSLCPGSGEQIGIAPFGDASITYSWSPETGLSDPSAPNPFFLGESDISYILTVSNGLCTSQAQQDISIFELDLMLSADTIICSGESVTLNVQGQGVASNFLWSTDPEFSNIISIDSILNDAPLTPTIYYVSADYLSCQALDSVSVVPADFSVDLSEDLFLCLGVNGNLSATNLYPEFEITYDWAPNSAIVSGDGSASIEINPIEDTNFILQLENELGCVWQEEILVEVSDLDVTSVNASATGNIIVQTGSTVLNGFPGDPYEVIWSPGTGLSDPTSPSTNASPNSTTTYTYTVIDDSPLGSCIGTDTVTIYVQELVCGLPTVFLPNSFSPNGDGENDILYLRGNLVESMTLEIYDRWGEKVFESSDQDVGWDGSYKNREADPAVYIYNLNAKCVDGQELNEQGNITLIR